MNLHAVILDNFLPDETFIALRAHADTANFGDFVSPVDNVKYPGICTDIDASIKPIIESRIQRLNKAWKVSYLFMRRSPQGTKAPHGAHTDKAMGTMSLMLYMNRLEHCTRFAGTSLLSHVDTGMSRNPVDEEELRIWTRDTNRRLKWRVETFCPARPNRAFLFDAELMHRADPALGFGTTPQEARLVLTAFIA